MKKDQLILIFAITIIALSGGVIFVMKSSPTNGQPTSSGPDKAQQGAMMVQRQIAQLESQLAVDPENFDLLVSLGNIYYDSNQPAGAVEYYERALKIKPDTPTVLVDCGAMYRSLGDADKAIEMFEKAIRIDSGLAQAYFNLGAVLRIEKQDQKGAAKAWKRYLELVPDADPEIKKLLEDEITNAG